MISMETQNYLLIDLAINVCDNVTVWDGDTNTWTPPPTHLALVQADTPAKVWMLDAEKQWVLDTVLGAGQIGFTWDGTALTTNEPQPEPQPTVVGAQEL